jgi:K+-transporting ATPase ATPase C chain
VTSPPYGGAAGGGSNLAVTSATLQAAVADRIAALRALDPGNSGPVPIDLVTASASGLDPHISPAAAAWQAGRVARARGLDPAEVTGLVAAQTEGRTLGILGEPRVNVVTLNLALDALERSPPRR